MSIDTVRCSIDTFNSTVLRDDPLAKEFLNKEMHINLNTNEQNPEMLKLVIYDVGNKTGQWAFVTADQLYELWQKAVIYGK